VNHIGDCGTAPDTQGLLNIYINFKKRIQGHLISQQLRIVAQIRGNSVPKPKEFCDAGKVIFLAVSLHNTTCCNLCVIDNKLDGVGFVDNKPSTD
jgi:hypothetical protein